MKERRSWPFFLHPLLLLTLILLLGMGLRLYKLGVRYPWRDELFDVYLAKAGFFGVFSMPLEEEGALLPLYPMLLSPYVHHADGPFLYRLPSAFIGLLSIAVIYKIGQSLLSRPAGLLSALFLATSVFHLQYSREARGYGLLILLSLLSLYGFLCLWRFGGGWRRWAAYVVATALLLYSHPFGFFLLGGEVIFFLVSLSLRRRHPWSAALSSRGLLCFVAAWLAVLLLYAPLAPRLVAVLSAGGEYYTLGTTASPYRPDRVSTLLAGLGRGFAGDNLLAFVTDWGTGYPAHHALARMSQVGRSLASADLPILAFTLMFLAGLLYSFLAYRYLFAFTFLVTMLPLAALMVLRPSHFFAPRYLSFILPLYVMHLALGVLYLGKMLRAVTLLALSTRPRAPQASNP